ncbi:3-oxoacyl-[acyl-carrier-protein] synthase isoform 1 [Theobroma cacao]|uniref:beta-ketoacyl-[acyl-carrier-protein] synthase I n=1 Tax=Theobroma cacao TaxID=3641 RepID=A0A061DLU7_THECC|nr:3-oxoacyl-[acyl-carrier-protein] synthase isoform 1 [Theobroma cacao]
MARPCWRKIKTTCRFQLSRHLCSSTSLPSRPLSSPRRVVVTGLGMVTPLGCGVETTWKHLIEGKCGIRALTPDDLKMNAFDRETQMLTFDQLTSRVAAIVPCGTNPGEFNEDLWLNSKEHRSIARFISYALCAADEALKDAKWVPTEQEQKERTGVSIGGGTGSIRDILDAAQMICEKRLRRLSPFFIPRILINMASGHVSMKYGFQGPNHAAVTACATGAHSIGDAMRMVQFGDADVMVAGGTESSIDALSIAGFCRARALTTNYNSSPVEASRPFDCGRDGFVIGEGSGVLVLEELEHAKRRGAKIYAEICGYGMSGDAYHITQPHTDGRGAILAMTRALKQHYNILKGVAASQGMLGSNANVVASDITLLESYVLENSGLHPNQVDYVNAHATSTPLGDAIEANAIKSTFADHAASGALAFSSTKGAVGHLLGAAGAVEAIFTVLAIHHGTAPLTLNVTKPDPIFNNAFTPLTASKEMPLRAALSNSFGFGGTNACLLFASPS